MLTRQQYIPPRITYKLLHRCRSRSRAFRPIRMHHLHTAPLIHLPLPPTRIIRPLRTLQIPPTRALALVTGHESDSPVLYPWRSCRVRLPVLATPQTSRRCGGLRRNSPTWRECARACRHSRRFRILLIKLQNHVYSSLHMHQDAGQSFSQIAIRLGLLLAQ